MPRSARTTSGASKRHLNLRTFILLRQVSLWLLLLLIGASVYWGIDRHASNARAASIAQHEMLLIENILREVTSMQSSVRGFAITGHNEHRQTYRQAAARLPRQFAELRRLAHLGLSPDAEEHLEAVNRAERITRDWRTLLAERVINSRLENRESALRLIDAGVGRSMTDAVLVQLGSYNAALHERQQLLAHNTRSALDQVKWITVASILAALALSFRSSNTIAGVLARVFGRMAHASHQLAEGHLEHTVKPSRLTEADALATNFNRMASSLLAAQDSLQLRHQQLERTLDKLQRSNNFSSLLLESAADGILGVDRSGRITFVNPAAQQLTGYEEAALLGRPHHQLIHPQRGPDTENVCDTDTCLVCSSMAEGETQRAENKQFWRRDDTSFPVEFVSAPLRDEHMQVIGAVVMFRDVTVRNQAQAELQRSNRELEQFAFVASHDLQGPLRTVASFTELLCSRHADQLDQQAQQYMMMIQNGVIRMKRLIDELLTYSSLRHEVQLTVVSANQAFAEAIQALQADIHERGAIITADGLPDVVSDATQLTLVFQNLLGNAIRYAEDGIPPRVHVHATEQAGMIQFEVQDNGRGIKAQYYERIFLLFQRLHREEEVPGSGVGLAVCQSIVERQGGRIWLESQPGAGSTFFFTLHAPRQPKDIR